MNYFNTRIVGTHAAVAQIHEGLFDFTANRLDQVIALADLRGRCVSVIRIANEAFGTHYQSLLMRHGETDFNPKLVTDSRLAFADTFHFGRVQRV